MMSFLECLESTPALIYMWGFVVTSAVSVHAHRNIFGRYVRFAKNTRIRTKSWYLFARARRLSI